MEFFQNMAGNDFIPYGDCYFWKPEILWAHVIGDGFIALAYFIMPIILIRFIRKRSDIRFTFIFGVFTIFMVLCGIVHLISVISVWNPYYRLEGLVKVITSIVSLGMVFLLIINFQKFLKIPSSFQLKALNTRLLLEIEQSTKKEFDLRQSERKFRLAMHNAPIAKALVALDGRWIEVNDATCKMLGYSRKELLTTDFQTLTHPDSLDLDLQNVQKLLDGNIENYQMEKQYIHKKGHAIWGLLGVSLVRDEDNKPLHFISQIVNIQQRKEAEQSILNFNRELERQVQLRTGELRELNQEMENFVYTVTHDLRLPLKNLTGLMSLLETDYDSKFDQNGRYILKLLVENADKMDTLIMDLLSFSRVKNIELIKDYFDIEQMMITIIEELRSNFDQNIISVDIPNLPNAYGDKKTIRQVCYNLLSNALKYSSKKEHIKIQIGAREENSQLVYWIKDNGVGFNDEANKDKLFAIFKRLHSPKDFQGTGVGLAMSKRILAKHNGDIWAESQVGQGATFYFSLPTRRNDKPSTVEHIEK